MTIHEKKLRLLVVEDETIISIDLEATAEEFGHTVVDVASHVDRAIDRIEMHENDIDCVMLDINLAGRSARPVAERLEARGIPYVVISGVEEKEVRRQGYRGPFISKPADNRQIGAALQEAARTAESLRELR
ncbi:response regulator [Histidinibacterium aquaticum]|uniref:Response regulator n=1 Tax=Histidinibacterium aquaticum TaxID=2613962 RepID=A0A5J5GCA4_9RHOB|nr:response regulator [Histidinibacterium aquaticum]KAA9005600.1 response regulator [Histidinibacterium aquaticum]